MLLNTFKSWLHNFKIGPWSASAFLYLPKRPLMRLCCSWETLGGGGVDMSIDCDAPLTRDLCVQASRSTQEPKHAQAEAR